MSDGMRRELVYLSSYATNRYFIPNWGRYVYAHNKNLKNIAKNAGITSGKGRNDAK